MVATGDATEVVQSICGYASCNIALSAFYLFNGRELG